MIKILIKNPRKYIAILLFAMIVLNSCTHATNINNENSEDNIPSPESPGIEYNNEYSVTNKSINPFFFQDGESVVWYEGVFDTGDDRINCKIKLRITDLGKYRDGNLFNIKLDPDGTELSDLIISGKTWRDDLDYWAYHLNLGYIYVEAEKIYKFTDVFEKGVSIIFNMESPECYVTCQNEELEDSTGEDVKGLHNYIVNEGDKRKSHFYNNAVETGYYENILWEKGVGLIYYNSGYGAEREEIQLNLIVDARHGQFL